MNKAETNTTTELVVDIAQRAGLGMMALAATVGMLELPEHPNSRAIVNMQPVFSFAGEQGSNDVNVLRREKEETGAHAYTNYSIVQRTPGRSGKY